MLDELWGASLTFAAGAFYVASRTAPITGILLMVGAAVFACVEYFTRNAPRIDPETLDELIKAFELCKTNPVAGDALLQSLLEPWTERLPNRRLERTRL